MFYAFNPKTMLKNENSILGEKDLQNLGLEYTQSNYADYMIFRKGNKYFLVNKIEDNRFKLQFSYSD
jgi:hypothetical protein